MSVADFTTTDLGVASSVYVKSGIKPEVVPQDGAPRAIFKFPRTAELDQALADLARSTTTQNTADLARARGELRERAIIVVASAQSYR